MENREERIRQYAYEWYLIRKANGDNSDKALDDHLRAEHIVRAQEWAEEHRKK